MILSGKNSSFKKGQKVDIFTEIMSEKIVFGYLYQKIISENIFFDIVERKEWF